jgi:hypothetical protein
MSVVDSQTCRSSLTAGLDRPAMNESWCEVLPTLLRRGSASYGTPRLLASLERSTPPCWFGRLLILFIHYRSHT